MLKSKNNNKTKNKSIQLKKDIQKYNLIVNHIKSGNNNGYLTRILNNLKQKINNYR